MFFGLDWISALVKVSFQVVFAIITGLVFWICWNTVAPVYFTFLPAVWLTLPYWHVVKMMLVFTYVGEMMSKLVPSLVTNNTNIGN